MLKHQEADDYDYNSDISGDNSDNEQVARRRKDGPGDQSDQMAVLAGYNRQGAFIDSRKGSSDDALAGSSRFDAGQSSYHDRPVHIFIIICVCLIKRKVDVMHVV